MSADTIRYVGAKICYTRHKGHLTECAKQVTQLGASIIIRSHVVAIGCRDHFATGKEHTMKRMVL